MGNRSQKELKLFRPRPARQVRIGHRSSIGYSHFNPGKQDDQHDQIELELIEKAMDEIENEYDDLNSYQADVELKNSSHQCITDKRSINNSLSVHSKQEHLKNFLGQDIVQIRRENTSFTDPYFKPGLSIITENVSGELANLLSVSLRITNRFDLNELNSKIKWKKSKVCDLS